MSKSGIVQSADGLGYRLDGTGFGSLQRYGFFSSLNRPEALWIHPTSYPGVKLTGRESGRSPLSSAETENA
jgi:hypothetical protein